MSADNLRRALTAFAQYRTPAKISAAIKGAGVKDLDRAWAVLDSRQRAELDDEVRKLNESGIDALLYGSPLYPQSLMFGGRPAAPVIFYRGDVGLFSASGVGMCGSRSVSDLGLKAARACGEEVSARGLVVTSGYARGVDTETHLASLRTGGRTNIVLAEGIEKFRVKKEFKEDFDSARVLLMSQFPPSHPWSAHAAMDRNKLIYGLGKALVVIEAGDKGGTLAAGMGALSVGRPVFVLDLGQDTPPGNRILLARGGRAITSRKQLGEALDSLPDRATFQAELPL